MRNFAVFVGKVLAGKVLAGKALVGRAFADKDWSGAFAANAATGADFAGVGDISKVISVGFGAALL